MKPSSMRLRYIIGLGAASILCGARALADDVTQDMIRMYSDPDEFYLFDQTAVHVIDYKSDHDIRICARTRQHDIPLQVDYDGKTAVIRPGDCFEFEAKEVSIEPAGKLPPKVELTGTIATR